MWGHIVGNRRRDGFGLRGTHARTEQIGGTMSVRSRPGTGTTIQIEIPA